MFIWRKRVAARTLAATEPQLRKFAGTTLALIEEPNRKTIIAEIAHARGDSLEEIRARFGGVIVQLPGDWLQKAQNQHRKPIKVGKRLIVARSRDAIATHPPGSAAPLIIPAGAAFGTGEHATTAMSLRLLEQLARTLSSAWSILDIGTGTGILALAARKFGARRVVAIDSDPRRSLRQRPTRGSMESRMLSSESAPRAMFAAAKRSKLSRQTFTLNCSSKFCRCSTHHG